MFRVLQNEHLYSTISPYTDNNGTETEEPTLETPATTTTQFPPVEMPQPMDITPPMERTRTNTNTTHHSTENPPLTRTISNIFNNNNIPNYLPTNTTMSPINPNHRRSFSNTTITDPVVSTYNSTPLRNSTYVRNTEEPMDYNPITTSNLRQMDTNSYVSMYPLYNNNNIPYYNLTPYNSPDGTPNLIPLNNENRTNPRNIIESITDSILFAIIDLSYNIVAEEPLTNQEITTHIKCCEYKDIINPLNTSCPITMDAFQLNTNVMQLINCGHIFTETELRRWLINKRICPMCRNNITQQI